MYMDFVLRRVSYAKEGVPPEEREYHVDGMGTAVGTIGEIKEYLFKQGMLHFTLRIIDHVEGDSEIQVNKWAS